MARARRRVASRGCDRRAADRRAANAVGRTTSRRCEVCDRSAGARMDGRGLCSAAAGTRESLHPWPRRPARLQLRARPRRFLCTARPPRGQTARAGPRGGRGLPGTCSIPRLRRVGQAHARRNRRRDRDAGLRRTWCRDRAPRHGGRPLAAVSRRASQPRHRRPRCERHRRCPAEPAEPEPARTPRHGARRVARRLRRARRHPRRCAGSDRAAGSRRRVAA